MSSRLSGKSAASSSMTINLIQTTLMILGCFECISDQPVIVEWNLTDTAYHKPSWSRSGRTSAHRVDRFKRLDTLLRYCAVSIKGKQVSRAIIDFIDVLSIIHIARLCDLYQLESMRFNPRLTPDQKTHSGFYSSCCLAMIFVCWFWRPA